MQAEVIHKKDVVAGLLYNIETRKLAFVKQFRMPVYLATQEVVPHLEVCAGYIDKDEKPEQAIVREIMEQTGIMPTTWSSEGGCFVSPGYTTEYCHLFLAEYDKDGKYLSKGGGCDEENEYTGIKEYSLDEVRKMVDNGTIKDMKTLLLIERFFNMY
jgi:nudix-type nucleoside diphosphatase (YffH/AdpP family)